MMSRCRFGLIGYACLISMMSMVVIPAQAAKITPAIAQKLAMDYYAAQAKEMLAARSGLASVKPFVSLAVNLSVGKPKPKSKSNFDFQPNFCAPQPSCLNVACDQLGSFGCDQVSDLQAVAAACQGNFDGNCLKTACAKLGDFGCDQLSDIQQVAAACRGDYGNCVQVTCDLLGSFGCDQLSDIQAVTQTCQNVDGECVRSACAHLGSFGCDQLSDIRVVAKACGGN